MGTDAPIQEYDLTAEEGKWSNNTLALPQDDGECIDYWQEQIAAVDAIVDIDQIDFAIHNQSPVNAVASELCHSNHQL